MIGIFLTFFLTPLNVCDSTFQYMGFEDPHYYKVQYDTCVSIARYSILLGVDPHKTVSAGIQESRLVPTRVSSANAKGPLQVTHFWCHEDLDDCNLTYAGVRALKLLRQCRYINWQDYTCKKPRKTPLPWREVFCHYNAGNKCTPESYEYADSIIKRAARIRRISRRI